MWVSESNAQEDPPKEAAPAPSGKATGDSNPATPERKFRRFIKFKCKGILNVKIFNTGSTLLFGGILVTRSSTFGGMAPPVFRPGRCRSRHRRHRWRRGLTGNLQQPRTLLGFAPGDAH